jgi:hypothetical protein
MVRSVGDRETRINGAAKKEVQRNKKSEKGRQ